MVTRMKPRTPLSREGLAHNMRWGLRWGLYFAAAYTSLGALGMLLAGGAMYSPEGRKLLLLLPLYWVGFPLAGLVLGILRPLTVRLLGQVLVASLAGLPISFGGLAIFMPRDEWKAQLVPAAIAFDLFVFPLSAAVNWILDKEKEKERR